MTIVIRDIEFLDRDAEGRSVSYNAEEHIPRVGGGNEDAGRLLIRLNLDGYHPAVYADLGRTGTLPALDGPSRRYSSCASVLQGVRR